MIVGIDPGTHRMGIAAIQDHTVVFTRLLGPGELGSKGALTASFRIYTLVSVCMEICEALKTTHFRADQVIHLAYEEPIHFSKSPRPILPLHEMVGALVFAATERGMLTFAYPSPKVKLGIAGRYNASKAEVQAVLMHEYNLHDTSLSSDEWDAIAVGTYHLAMLR